MIAIRSVMATALLVAAFALSGGAGAVEPNRESTAKARAALALAEAAVHTGSVAAAGTIDTSPCMVQCASGHGSGTAIQGGPPGKTWFITNRHVARIGIKSVKMVDGTVYPASVVEISQTHDLAILVVNAVLPAVEVVADDPPVGTGVRVRGNGVYSGGFDKVRSGTIKSYSGGDLTANLLGSPGDSGSGYFNAEGKLVGVLWGGPSKDLSQFSIGVRASAVYAFVQKVSGKPVPNVAYDGYGYVGHEWGSEDAEARARAALALAEAEIGFDRTAAAPGRAADPKAACVRVGWKQWGASGTCVAVSGGKSLVVTNNHLFSEFHDAEGQFPRGNYPLPATVTPIAGGLPLKGVAVDGDRESDLAFVIVDGVLPYTPLAAADAPVGTAVWHAGVGSGGGSGAVLPPTDHPQPKHRFNSTCPSTSGDSGAGLFDPAGAVVAINCGRNERGNERGTPVSAVRPKVAALAAWPPR